MNRSEKDQHNEALRRMPSVDATLQSDEIQDLCKVFLRGEVVTAIRDVLASWRTAILDSSGGNGVPNGSESRPGPGEGTLRFLIDADPQSILLRLSDDVRRHLEGFKRTSLKSAVNATGIILHTNLGRAVIAEQALDAIVEVSRSYSLLEMDQASGERSKRDVHVTPLFLELTGAEAVTFVNNNAGATLIILDTLAKGKEVLLSRGEMVEIGGSFRIPDVIEKSGCKLVGVGTTNRTHLRDFESAITDETAAILRVHPSNYEVVGFTKSVPIEELAALGKRHGIPVIDDLGSGCLFDFTAAGLDEPVLSKSLEAGVDLVCFSTDKLLGGPQGGGIAGKKRWVDAIRKNALARALRMDKLRLAALEATLRLYRNPDVARVRIPTVRMIMTPAEEIRDRAEALRKLVDAADLPLDTGIVDVHSNIGGGSLPNRNLASFAVRIVSDRMPSQELAYRLRQAEPAVIARIRKEEVLLDLRTILPGQEEAVVNALKNTFWN